MVPPGIAVKGLIAADPEASASWKLTHQRLVLERDRLRDARAFFARQLGPLPAFAGISVGIVAAFSEKIEHEWALWVALGIFAGMVAASIAYSRMPTYRELRHRRLDTPEGQAEGQVAPDSSGAPPEAPHAGDGKMTPADWYEAEIKLETQIYGDPQRHPKLWVRPWKAWYWPRRDFRQNLQVQMDRERFGVFLVQTLFLLVISLLVIGR